MENNKLRKKESVKASAWEVSVETNGYNTVLLLVF